MKKTIICIGRQLGSGGSEIARILARQYGCKLYDRELLNLAARESGFSEMVFQQSDEHKGFFRSLISAVNVNDNFSSLNPSANSGNSWYHPSPLSDERLFQIQSDVILHAAEEGPCIFVGRCADYVLREHPQMASIFVTADLAERVARVAERRQCSHDEAERFIQKMESRRAQYYNYYTGKQWGHAASYHLCISTTPHGIEKTAEIIMNYVL